ncbi:MAG: putative chromate transport protein [bacterium]|nr:putative chromate transport protein [bacterium]
MNARTSLAELAKVFFKLGVIGFGGPAAHIAMMEEETVKRRKWLTHEQFLDLLGATNLIPGPNSTEMAIHVGYVKAGWRGLAVAGSCFIFPAVAITLFFAYLYVHFGTVPQLAAFMFGIRAAIIAVILAAVYRLSRPLLKKRHLIVIGLSVAVCNVFHLDEIVLLFGAGLVNIVWEQRKRIWQRAFSLFNVNVVSVFAMFFSPLTKEVNAASASLVTLGLFFLKVGAILYGSGYVLVAFLQGGLVESYHWLTQQQLLDAIAIGQFTPGPILSTATFIGYVLLGLPGAAVATIGVFLPSFIFVMLSSPLIPKLRGSPLARSFLDGVNAGALGLMLAVCFSLGLASLTSVAGGLIFGLAIIVLVVWNLNAAWIILGSACLGWLFSLYPL